MSSQTQAPIAPSQNRYLLARGIARRARHLFHGARPLVGAPASLTPTSTAEREFEMGLARVTVAGNR